VDNNGTRGGNEAGAFQGAEGDHAVCTRCLEIASADVNKRKGKSPGGKKSVNYYQNLMECIGGRKDKHPTPHKTKPDNQKKKKDR